MPKGLKRPAGAGDICKEGGRTDTATLHVPVGTVTNNQADPNPSENGADLYEKILRGVKVHSNSLGMHKQRGAGENKLYSLLV